MKRTSCLARVVAAVTCLAAAHALADASAARLAAGGDHTCAVADGGTARCWGSNAAGELGDGTMTSRAQPVEVAGLPGNVAAMALGDSHSCALTSFGGVKCWGNNFRGQLGNGGATQSLTPVDVTGLSSGVKAIVAGAFHTCALTFQGGVLCWGDNLYGQLGDGGNTTRRTPVEVSGLRSGVASIGAGRNHSCAVLESGEGLCWGNNVFGQVGAPRTDSNTPRVVQGLESGTLAIAGGDNHSCALTTAGAVKCWGAGSLGQLGYAPAGSSSATPTVVPGLEAGLTGIAAYRNHSCAVTAAGGVKCWGWNGSGQLGDSTTTTRVAPVDALGVSQATAVATGANHSCAAVAGGGVRCWGNNFDGQLGDGTLTARLAAVAVAGFAGGQVTNLPGSYTGLFWNPAESGWGLHVTQRGPMVFAAWFGYDATGAPRWYVVPACRFDAVDGRVCQGTAYETQGSGFLLGMHFSPVIVDTNAVGEVQLSFDDRDHVRMRYTLRGISRDVALVRQVFGNPAPMPVDYTDLWWNPAEPGWGMAITHRGDTMFLAWFVYDANGRPLWYVASDCRVAAGATCAGSVYRTRGPAAGTAFDPTRVQATLAGSVQVSFTDASNGTIRYSIDGLDGEKRITRQIF